jgi:hypothetical protein
MKRFLLLLLFCAFSAFGQKNYNVLVSGNLSGAVAALQPCPTQPNSYLCVTTPWTPWTPTDSNTITVTCPTLILPGGGFYAGWSNAYNTTGGLLTISFPGSNDWSVPVLRTACSLVVDAAPFPFGQYTIYVSYSMVGSSAAWGDVLSLSCCR